MRLVSEWPVISRQGTYMDSWRKRRTLYMVMRDVGDDDIMIIGYIFSAWGVNNEVTWKNSDALCLRACAFGSASETMS